MDKNLINAANEKILKEIIKKFSEYMKLKKENDFLKNQIQKNINN